MGSYYCLMAGLPDLSLEDNKLSRSVNDFKNELEEVLSAKDKSLMYYFYLKYDCDNILNLLKNPDSEINDNGNFNKEQYLDLIKSAQEMNFNVHRYPTFLSIFAREYSYNVGKSGYFPEDMISLEYYNYSMKCPNKMIANWYKLNFNISNILTAMIARKYGWNVSDYIVGNNEICEMIRNNNTKDFNLSYEYDYVSDLMKIVDCENPVEKEKRIDAFKWIWLDEQTFFDIFSIDAVFAYMCKLQMLERWEKLDPQAGRETFRKIIDDLRSEVKVPKEYKV